MARDGLLIGEVAAQSGVSRKALRLYEVAGILPPPRRTAAGHRAYGGDTLSILAFVTRARRLDFRLDEIKEVVQMRRSGHCPCPHVLDLVREKVGELDRALADLTEVRRGLQELLRSSRSAELAGTGRRVQLGARPACPSSEQPAGSSHVSELLSSRTNLSGGNWFASRGRYEPCGRPGHPDRDAMPAQLPLSLRPRTA
jgi:MerR family transcriptional regulator, copper efflux regulator